MRPHLFHPYRRAPRGPRDQDAGLSPKHPRSVGTSPHGTRRRSVRLFRLAGITALALSLVATLQAALAAYAAPGQTIDQALGCTRSIQSVLESHLNDGYYLGTPYGNQGPGIYGDITTSDAWWPNGNPKPGVGAYMNCAGFVTAVVREAGGDTSPVAAHVSSIGYHKGNESNASQWYGFANDRGFLAGQYNTKEEMLASGILEKGDIIYIHPTTFGGDNDCHIMFFWGSNPHEDLAWHSALHGDGVIAGSSSNGNMISRITPKGPAAFYQVFKVQHSVEVTFQKVSSRDDIDVTLDAYQLEGATYEIRRAADDALVSTITTDAAGTATLALEPSCAYYAQEVTAPQGYVVNPERIPFNTGETTSVELPDAPGTLTLHIQKRDAATGGEAQAGASLEGATYRLVDAGGVAHTGVTDADGELTFDNLPLGEVRVTEEEAPVGYRLDPTPRTYTVDPRELLETGVIELAPADDFAELPIAFDIDLVKYRDTGSDDSGLQQPAEGVRFDIISGTTGEVVGSITTDADGRASTAGAWFGAGERVEGISGALPFDRGGYTVREAPETVPEGHRPAPDWHIAPEEMVDGTTLKYTIDNERVTSRLQIVKADAETGRAVPAAGFTFQLLDADRNPIAQEIWYPNHTTVDRFTTDETGSVTLPVALEPGTYYVREIETVPPYLLADEDLAFTISPDAATPELTVITFADEQAHGRAHLQKTCAAAADKPAPVPQALDRDADETEGAGDTCICQGMAGAEFDVVALDDVTGPDGTVYALANEVVDHVVVDDGGEAYTGELPLGCGEARYALVETVAPAGHVLDPTPHEFTLSYLDPYTSVVEAGIIVANAPTEVTLDKCALGDETPVSGAVFELWRAEDDVYAPTEDEGTAPVVTGPAEGATREFTTNADGHLSITHLTEGAYRLREKDAPDGYLVDDTIRFFTVDGDGLVEGLPLLAMSATDDYTKVDISKRDVTDESEVPGARLAVYDANDELVESWVSTEEEHRLTRLEPGTYTLVEELTPHHYDQATSVTFTVEPTGSVQRVVMYDEPISVSGEIDKRQQIARPVHEGTEPDALVDEGGTNRAPAQEDDAGTYAYTVDFRSTSSTWVDEFAVTDHLDAVTEGLAELTALTTPIAFEDYDGLCNVWYQTDQTPQDHIDPSGANATRSDGHVNPWLDDETTAALLGDDARALDYTGWRLWAGDVPTNEARELAVADLGLSEGEHVTAVRIEFGRVEEGFTSRSDEWDRELIDDEHDDLAGWEKSEGGAPLVLHMRATDTYRPGTVLENSAQVDLYRNGGNTADFEELEDHDGDRVAQQPRGGLSLLPQTGLSSPVPALLVTALGAGALWTWAQHRTAGGPRPHPRARHNVPRRRSRP